MIDFSAMNRAVMRTFGDNEEDVIWLDKPSRRRQGIFDSRHWPSDLDGEVAVSELITTLSVESDPLDIIAKGERVNVRGVEYRITDKEPQGEGWELLRLELVEL